MQQRAARRFSALMMAGALAATFAVSAQETGDPAAGREKAKACRACHGLDGLSLRPDTPHIAGQIPLYLREQLLRYRSGQRVHAVMGVVAQSLTDADIEDLVAYYSSINITAEPPP